MPARREEDRMKLHAMTCGWIEADLDAFLAGEPGRLRIPVPSYLIEHPRGRVLFDTGLHPATQSDPVGRLGEALAAAYHVEFQPGEEIERRLETLDVAPDSVDFIVNSHLHFDHTGGNQAIPNATLVVQRREWEAGQDPDQMVKNFYDTKDYDLGHALRLVDGEHDLFGDGSVVCVPTYGHTPGHQSLRVRMNGRDILLAADTCYLKRTLEEMKLPPFGADPSAQIESLKMLRRLQASGTEIFYGHDPEFWKSVPQAPARVA
jgi:glyoxylase-like metal-dependent hydrolase (beta-lactamase superfamily II)